MSVGIVQSSPFGNISSTPQGGSKVREQEPISEQTVANRASQEKSIAKTDERQAIQEIENAEAPTPANDHKLNVYV